MAHINLLPWREWERERKQVTSRFFDEVNAGDAR